MGTNPHKNGLYDAILAVFGGAAGGVAYAALTEPAGVRLTVFFALLGMVWLVAWVMNTWWDEDED